MEVTVGTYDTGIVIAKYGNFQFIDFTGRMNADGIIVSPDGVLDIFNMGGQLIIVSNTNPIRVMTNKWLFE
ncbi:MAG: hypothetical protein K2Q22_07700 [Cytophagales bacterium]|nr:hypothetical protein [Cytophagales bacterium]